VKVAKAPLISWLVPALKTTMLPAAGRGVPTWPRSLLLHVSPHVHFGDPAGVNIPFIVYSDAFW
jgi:hypothetical protein